MDPVPPILVLDDDPDVALAARYALSGLAARIDQGLSLDGLEERVGQGRYAAVLLDMNFVAGESAGRAGLDGLGRIKAADPAVAVVLMTAYGGVQLAVEALKRGAADFVLKPEVRRSRIWASATSARPAARNRSTRASSAAMATIRAVA